jgi:hypothetical protein
MITVSGIVQKGKQHNEPSATNKITGNMKFTCMVLDFGWELQLGFTTGSGTVFLVEMGAWSRRSVKT